MKISLMPVTKSLPLLLSQITCVRGRGGARRYTHRILLGVPPLYLGTGFGRVGRQICPCRDRRPDNSAPEINPITFALAIKINLFLNF